MNKLLAVGVVVALLLGVFAVTKPSTVERVIERVQELGALSGPEVLSYLRVHGHLTQGGGVYASSSSIATFTLPASDMEANSILRLGIITGGAQTDFAVTLPASTTFPSISNAGMSRSWLIENTAVGATTTTIVAGDGIDLQEPDGQNIIIGQNNYAWLTCFREVSTDIVCLVNESIPAD